MKTRLVPQPLREPVHLLFWFVLIGGWYQLAQAQIILPPTRGTASVSGTIMMRGQPAANIAVSASVRGAQPPFTAKTVARTKTDAAGHYQLQDLPAGEVVIAPQPAAYVVSNAAEGDERGGIETRVSLEEGQAAKDIDFTLTPGAVITGRVTTEDGRPVIGETVSLSSPTTPGPEDNSPPGAAMVRRDAAETDDRGVYRIYGLTPGKYLISCGRDAQGGGSGGDGFGGGDAFYTRVFYPAAVAPAEATVIDLAEGAEAVNIDLRLGKVLHGYRASGRIASSKTGEPLKRAFIRAAGSAGTDTPNYYGFALTDEDGEFTLSGLQPGSYKLEASGLGSSVGADSNLIVQDASFQIVDSDITGLEIKAVPGIVVSGTIVLENTSTAPLPFRTADLTVLGAIATKDDSIPNYSQASIRPDGSFTLTGLPAGRLVFGLFNAVPGLRLQAVERGGVRIPGMTTDDSGPPDEAGSPVGLVVDADHPVTDLVLRVIYGNCRLRGQIVQPDGSPVHGYYYPRAKRVDGTGEEMGASVDNQGHFSFEGLTPGQYEVKVDPTKPGKLVTVSNGADNTVTLTVEPPKDDDQ